MTRQLIAIEFAPMGRSYTYHNDGVPVAVGQQVRVQTPRGPQTVTVVSVNPPTPKFETKPILGRADPPRERQGSLL